MFSEGEQIHLTKQLTETNYFHQVRYGRVGICICIMYGYARPVYRVTEL